MIDQYTHAFLQVVLCIGSVFALAAFAAAMVLLTRGLHMVSTRIRDEEAMKLEQQAQYRRMKKFTEEDCQ